MRAGRLVQLLLLLQANGRMTASRLAVELEVSVRTVYRDLEALSGAGVPVLTEPGPGGGCQLIDGYRTRLTGLTTDEAGALALTGLPDAAAELGLGTVLAAAQLKVDAALPAELRSRAVRVRERFHVDAPGWSRRPEDVSQLPVLAEGLWEERRLEVRYRRGDQVVRRVLDPLGLVLKAGTWYLVARAGRRGDIRTYRVGRVVGARLRAERFVRPDGFDLAAAWAANGESFARQMLSVPVEARLRADAVARLRTFLDPTAARLAAESAVPDRDGWVRLTIPSEPLEVAVSVLLQFGDALEVVGPPEVRAALARQARALAAVYGSEAAPAVAAAAPAPVGASLAGRA